MFATTTIDGGSQLQITRNSRETYDTELAMEKPSRPTFWQHLNTDVDPAQSTGPLAAFCFMSGFMDAISFSAISVWCGFQTGNSVQLFIAIARRNTAFHIADRQAITSLLSFQTGAFFGRLAERMGPHKRSWLVLSTLVQVMLTMAGALVIWKSGQDHFIAAKRGDRSWTNALTFIGLAFMSASLGIQGVVAKRLNTQLNATLVLTTVWVELIADPQLFKVQKVITRDHRLIVVVVTLGGAFISQAILAQINAAGALCVGAGLRVLIAFAWIVIPGKPVAR
ncbi:hypothetical protein B0H19DRAFT_1203794 [Mycena capillaripes]|nr:hypothetical protein B0H19DRAFT_1203794 [Mycena capillaripes]